MQRPQRTGIALLILLCIGCMAVSVWRSRSATRATAAPGGGETTAFTVLSTAPPAQAASSGRPKHPGKPGKSDEPDRPGKSGKSDTPGQSDRPDSTVRPTATRDWLNDL